jgi:hypothetical protein
MSATYIKDYLVGLGFDVDDAGLAKFEGALTKIALGAAAAGAAVVAAAAAIVGAVQNVAAEYDQLDKLATQFRTTADAVDEFADIGKVLGLSEEQTIGGLKALDRAIGDTALGLGRAKKVFEEIGVAVLDAAGKMKPTTQVMDQLASVLATMEKGKAIAVMDRLGLDPALMKVFNADLGQLRLELAEIDKAAGFDLTEAVKQSKAFMRTWKGMQQEWQKVQIVIGKLYESIAVKLMPRLSQAVDEMRRRIESARRFIMENMEGVRSVIANTVDAVLRVFGFFWAIFGRVIDAIVGYVKLIITAFGQLDPTLQTTILTVGGLIAAWKLLNASFLLSPVGAIVALGIAILALYDDYKTWTEGGESLIDWSKWKTEIDMVTSLMDGFKSTLKKSFEIIFATVDALASLLRGDFTGAWRAAGDAVSNVIAIFKDAFGWVMKLVDGVGKFAGLDLAKLGAKIKVAIDATSTAVSSLAGDPTGTTAIANAGTGSPDPLAPPAPLGLARLAEPRLMAPATPLGVPATPFAPAAAGSGSTVNNTSNQNVTVTVNGSDDPAATGRAVAREIDRTAATTTRNAIGAVR